jgi:PhzF family phenazine biosynthesis protein
MNYAFRIVNVFTVGTDRFSGNPLAVFEDARGLDAEVMQRLALQFNLSETTFILPSERAEARVRIFTPGYEMPFAGHPTLGTAQVVAALRGDLPAVRLEMIAGVIPVQRRGSRWQFRANAPSARRADEDPATLAALLGLEQKDLGDPALWVNTGNEQLIVPLRSEAAVRRVKVDGARLAALHCVHGNPKVYVFAELGGDRILSRFFFPKGAGLAILEDPATGSACANLGGYFVATGAARPLSRIISQGEYTGRPSTLYLDVDADAGIDVAGEVIELARGSVELPD